MDGAAYLAHTRARLGEQQKLYTVKEVPTMVEYPESVQYAEVVGVRWSSSMRAHLDRVKRHDLCLMSGTAEEATFLALLGRMIDARRIIEVGTFLGFTSMVLAEQLPKATVVTLDFAQEVVDIAKEAWREAGVDNRIESRIGAASESLKDLLETEGENSFDMAFIDADKSNYDEYYELCLKLVRPNGLILVDNVLWFGRPARGEQDPDTIAISSLNLKIHQDPRVDISLVPFADGLTICVKK